MSHIICPDLAPASVDSLLRDLYYNETELDIFMESVLSDVRKEDFGSSAMDTTPSICSCEAIVIIVQCRTIDLTTREDYLREERPQDEFEKEDFATWDGVLLAMQFASIDVLTKISNRIPIELIACAIAVLPPGTQMKAKEIFYQ